MCELVGRIAEQAAARPHAVALHDGTVSLSYQRLSDESSRLAGHLRSLGVREGVAVALCYPRSFSQIIAALAVMQAGGAYVPLDPAWPGDRIRHILQDSGATIFIAPEEFSEFSPADVTVLSLGATAGVIAQATPLEHSTTASPESLAYIIYTSGSTGTPKGVEITHGNLAHLIAWHCSAFKVTNQDHASHLAGLGFDASVWEVWPYLSTGASLSLADDMTRTSPVLLQQWIVDKKITMAFIPTPLAEPMMMMEWPNETALRLLLTGGDALHTMPRAGLPFSVINNYGPTECTVVATSGIVSADLTGTPTIGSAITATQIYILNEQGEIAAPGETGELVIGGTSVGRGYRNQPELTAKSFVQDRFSGRRGGMLYKTGDQAAALADGQISFRGRVDGQEKIRGQRLELGEIITVLNRHEAVSFSTVKAQGAGDEKHLVGYIMAADGAVPTARELQEYLATSLPSYMIPSHFVRLTSIPLNANGKVDPALLPAVSPENTLPELASRGPSTPIEETILAIVQDLLKTEDVGVDDDFFLIGGHSLMGTRLVMRVRETFGVSITLRDLFESGTVAGLSAQIEAKLMAELDSMTDEEAAKQAAE